MNRFLERLRRTLFTGTAFVLFFFGGLVLSYLLLPLARLAPRTRAEKSRLCRALVSRSWLFFHDLLRLLGLLRCDPRAFRFDLPDGPYVLVANHPTLIDVTALIAAIPNLVVVAKTPMFRNPFVGRLLRYCDHIESGEGTFAGGAVLLQALNRLSTGTPVLIFPEGTRSPARGVGMLRRGAFDLVARSGVPMVAVFIRCEPPTLLRGEPWHAVPSHAPSLMVTQLRTMLVRADEVQDTARRLQDEYQKLASEPAVGEPDARARPASIIQTQGSHGRA